MEFEKSDFIVLRSGKGGVWGFMKVSTKQGVEDYLTINSQSVLVRFNVRTAANNNPCETYADAEKALAEEKKKNPDAVITMMAPNRELPSDAQQKYYDAEHLFVRK